MRLCIADGVIWVDHAPFAQPAPQQLSEELLEAWHDSKTFRILGKSGSVYVIPPDAESIGQVLTPPIRFGKASRVGTALIALARQALYRSDDGGASWQRLWVEPELPVDFAVDGLGRVALLEIPERLWQSTDGARHFTVLEQLSQGVTALVTEQHQIRTVSIRQGRAPLLPQVADSAVPPGTTNLEFPVAEYLGASDFAQRRVVELDARYLVARPTDSGWSLLSGALGKPLAQKFPMRGIACSRLQLASDRDHLWVFCSDKTPEDVAQPIVAYVSQNGGHDFQRAAPDLFGIPRDLVATSPVRSDGLLVSGICSPEPLTTSGSTATPNQTGCVPRGILRLELDPLPATKRLHVTLRPLACPGLSTPALALSASASGQTIVAVGRRAKNGTLSLLLSKDAGRSFSARSLADVLGNDASLPPRPTHSLAAPALSVASLSLADDGSFSLVTKHGDQPRLYSFDPDGTLLSAAIAPKAVSRLCAFEDQALALSVTEGVLYESTERGTNFEPIVQHLPPTCLDAKPCDLVCRRQGCLVGDMLTRIGYRHRTRPYLGLAASVLNRDAPAPITPNAVLAQCEMARSGWQHASGQGTLPNATSAGFHDLAFYWLIVPTRKANVHLAEVTREQPKLAFKPLFKDATSVGHAAVAVQRGPHGWAAALLRRVGANREPIGELDFAWADLTEATRSAAHARFQESIGRVTLERPRQGPMRFAPVRLSPQGAELYAQLEPDGPSGEHSVYRLSAERAPQLLHFGGWQGIQIQSTDVARVAGKPTPTAIAGSNMVLVRGAYADSTFGARTLAPNPSGPGAAFNASAFARLGKSAGVLVRWANTGDTAEHQLFYPLAADDALVAPAKPIPAPFTAERHVARCDQRRRHDAERIVVDIAPAESVELSITGASSAPLRLISMRAVLYLDPAGACWDVVEARDDAAVITGLLFADAPTRAWVFRSTRDLDGTERSEYATLSCHAPPNLPGESPRTR